MKEKFPWIKEAKTQKGEVTADNYLIGSQKLSPSLTGFLLILFLRTPEGLMPLKLNQGLITAFPRVTAIGG